MTPRTMQTAADRPASGETPWSGSVCRTPPRSLPDAVADHVAGAANRVQQRTVESLVDLGAQARDVYVNDVGLRIEVVIPDVLQQHGAGHDLAGMLHQIFEQAELA